MQSNSLIRLIRALAVTLALFGLNGCVAASRPAVDHSYTTHELSQLPPPKGQRKKVSIYQFDSSVDEVSARAATDMFTTALVKSGHFAVFERQRLSEGVLKEKSMNTKGMTTGDVSQSRLTGVDYLFQGTVSEANTDQSNGGVAASARGLGVEANNQKAVIAVDVRVVDAHSGAILGAIDVRRDVKQAGVGVSGIGAFVQSFVHKDLQGADVSVNKGEKEGVDRALRECIEQSVYQLAQRFGG